MQETAVNMGIEAVPPARRWAMAASQGVGRAKSKAFRTIAWHGNTRVGRKLGAVAFMLWRACENDDGSGESNGEDRVLDELRDLDCVFDVGAHHGDWTGAVIDRHSGATVHAFEIEPAIRAVLRERFETDPRVVMPDCGLADSAGDSPIWVNWQRTEQTSLIDNGEGWSRHMVSVETGDRYMAAHGIDKIDLLKIDVEGAELRVLAGFESALAEGRIRAIQFEFTLWAAIARVWLRDFYDLLSPLGYTLGKIYPTWTDWRDYAPEHEIFVRANFLAIARPGHGVGSSAGLAAPGSSNDQESGFRARRAGRDG